MSAGLGGSWHPCVVTGLALSLSMHDENGALPYHYPVIIEGLRGNQKGADLIPLAPPKTLQVISLTYLGVPKGRFGDPLVAVAKTVGSP